MPEILGPARFSIEANYYYSSNALAISGFAVDALPHDRLSSMNVQYMCALSMSPHRFHYSPLEE